MKLTEEQEYLKVLAKDENIKLLKIEAVAGAGKTSTLIDIAKSLKLERALYTAFNKAIVLEAGRAFPSNVACKTLHAVAYAYVMPGTNRTIEEFTYSCIKEELEFPEKVAIRDTMNAFFNSASLTLSYFDDKLPEELAPICKKYINKMMDGSIPITFGLMLKLFHLGLSDKSIIVKPYDLVMLDEAGDVTGVTLEIFKLIPAKKKIMVGDTNQNIYTFMGTVNGFEALADEGTSGYLSQSFRVSADIALKVQHFMRAFVNVNFVFRGIEYDKSIEPKNLAYISRTNAGIINRMIDLHAKGLKYNIIRDPGDIFSLPLALINLKEDRPPYKREHRYLRTELIKYNNSPILQRRYSSFFKYLLNEFSADSALVGAIRLLQKHSYNLIFETYKEAKCMPTTGQDIILTTAHASKGLTFDSVYIENDMNKLIAACTDDMADADYDSVAEIKLAYVAATRAKYKLFNARFLEDGYKYDPYLDPLG